MYGVLARFAALAIVTSSMSTHILHTCTMFNKTINAAVTLKRISLVRGSQLVAIVTIMTTMHAIYNLNSKYRGQLLLANG